MKAAALTAVALLTPVSAATWGGRGHHAICSAAVHLVKNEELKSFLIHRPHTMGHLCNIPDIYWKSLSGEVRKLGDPTHYINPEKLGLKIAAVPLELAEIQSAPGDFGSLWWRADQFMRRIAVLKKDFVEASPPKGFKEEQDEKLPYNRAVYEFMVNAGLLGHFVGDAGQVFHSTADYDGWQRGHGGIHSYYEEQIIAEAPADLETRIVQAAQRLKKAPYLKPGPIVERMRSFSESSFKDLELILKSDPVLRKSTFRKEKGLELKTPAERAPAREGWKKLGPTATQSMGRSAAFLAALWDEAFLSAGAPKLSAYRSFRYPFTPDFIPPDYPNKLAP